MHQLRSAVEKLEIVVGYDVSRNVAHDRVKLASMVARDLIQNKLLNGEPHVVGLLFLDKKFLSLNYVPGCPVQRLIFSSQPDILVELDPVLLEKLKGGV